jgi:hypothetical protein
LASKPLAICLCMNVARFGGFLLWIAMIEILGRVATLID